ncbi:unnamed protein product [Withania somnifera]
MEGKEMVIFTIMVMLWWSVGNCLKFDSTVAKDGSGKYKTIAQALDAAPKNSSKTYFIHVKRGIYDENITISSDQTNIGLVGDGMGVTIITARKSSKRFPTPYTATLGVYGSGFIGMFLTIRNTAGAIGGQAVALTSATFGGVASYYRCSFEGYQDTIFVQTGSTFFRECDVSGTIDFIFGGGQAIFQNSVVKARSPLPGQEVRIIAPGVDNIIDSGLILQNCKISSVSGFNNSVSSFLGWPWKSHGKGVIMSSYIDGFIDPKGWTPNPKEKDDIYLAEYNNRGPGSSTKYRVKWSKVINKKEASKFTVRNFLHGDKWIPRIIPHYLDHVDGVDDYV